MVERGDILGKLPRRGVAFGFYHGSQLAVGCNTAEWGEEGRALLAPMDCKTAGNRSLRWEKKRWMRAYTWTWT